MWNIVFFDEHQNVASVIYNENRMYIDIKEWISVHA